ncbi:hypothetical protein, partial [Microcoleus sp.]|uniref:hypothetical protein n=1 Tax=Microcoleus sp. TaxID=44472 RepID=UPI00352321F4
DGYGFGVVYCISGCGVGASAGAGVGLRLGLGEATIGSGVGAGEATLRSGIGAGEAVVAVSGAGVTQALEKFPGPHTSTAVAGGAAAR